MNGELEPNPRGYQIDDMPAELLVGEPLEFTITVSHPVDSVKDLKQDWVGVYPATVPTLPGLSHRRWKYLSTSQIITHDDERTLKVRFEPRDLPNHHGWFDVRVHLANSYGAPHESRRIYLSDGDLPLWKRVILMAAFFFIIYHFQEHLNAKGNCPFVDPELNPTDVFVDELVLLTAPLNLFFIKNPAMAEAAQAASSFSLDFHLLFLIYVGAIKRSSVRPYLSPFIFQFFRFLGQIMATIPCAPGYYFPPGRLWGHAVPTLFVDYKPANDMFFSGHVGTTLVLAIELFALDFTVLGLMQGLVAVPLMSVWVIATRVHRGIDVYAGLLAAIAACAISKEVAGVLDQALRNGAVMTPPRLAAPLTPPLKPPPAPAPRVMKVNSKKEE